MLQAYIKNGKGKPLVVDSMPALAAAWSQNSKKVWVDIENPTAEELAELVKIIDLDNEALDDCVRGEQRPRIDDFGDYIFLVAYGMMGRDEHQTFSPRKLAVFCGPKFLITVHRDSLASIDQLHTRATRENGAFLSQGVDQVLYLLLDTMADYYLEVVARYEEQIDDLEDRSLAGDTGDDPLSEVSDLRREFIQLRRLVASQNQLLLPIAKGNYDFIAKNLSSKFAHVRDQLSTALERIDALREILSAVVENYRATIALRTNAVMKVLTIYSAVMLPLSLIAGLYGMNVPLWPATESPYTFWVILGTMGTLAAGLVFLFRSIKWT